MKKEDYNLFIALPQTFKLNLFFMKGSKMS
jgi:hypothetical protein